MRQHLKRALLLVLAFCLFYPPTANAAPLFAGLTLKAIAGTTMKISWKGKTNDTCKITVATEDGQVVFTDDVTGTEAIVPGLAPECAYTVTVRSFSDKKELTGTITLPPFGPFREDGYRWDTCRVYSSASEISEDFWDDSRHRINNLTQSEVETLAKREAIFVVLEYWINATKTNKQWTELMVLKTPGGKVYASAWEGEINKSWTGARTPFPLYHHFQEMMDEKGGVEAGDYVISFYFNGGFAGSATFTVKPD